MLDQFKVAVICAVHIFGFAILAYLYFPFSKFLNMESSSTISSKAGKNSSYKQMRSKPIKNKKKDKKSQAYSTLDVIERFEVSKSHF